MPENYRVEATVLSLGDMEQINFTNKRTGQPDVFTKFKVECQVGNESTTYEANGFHRSKLEVGGHYSLEVQPNDYTHNIRKIEPAQPPSGHLVRAAEAMGVVITEEVPTPPVAPPPNSNPNPAPQNRPSPPQNATQGISQGPTLRPDIKERWMQYNTHARTAQMQATERVNTLKEIFLAGKLLNNDGEVVDKLRLTTVMEWWSAQIDHYWRELEMRVPYDAHGRLAEGYYTPDEDVNNVSS